MIINDNVVPYANSDFTMKKGWWLIEEVDND